MCNSTHSGRALAALRGGVVVIDGGVGVGKTTLAAALAAVGQANKHITRVVLSSSLSFPSFLKSHSFIHSHSQWRRTQRRLTKGSDRSQNFTHSVSSSHTLCIIFIHALYHLHTRSVSSTHTLCIVFTHALYHLHTRSVSSSHTLCFVFTHALFRLHTHSVSSSHTLCFVFTLCSVFTFAFLCYKHTAGCSG
jgi:hypothetical protein